MPWLVAIIAVVWGWGYLLDGEKDMCQARTKYVAEQAPYALQILASRHPLSVGLVRSYLNQNGDLDRFVEEAIRENGKVDEVLACAFQNAVFHVEKDQIRIAMADEMEKGFGIKGYP